MKKFRSWPKWLKITTIVFASLFALLFISGIFLKVYVSNNKEKIIKQITEKVNESTDGTLKIGDLNASVFSNFPNISVILEDVSLVDSYYNVHRHELISAKKVYLSVDVLSLFSSNKHLNKVLVEDGGMYMYVDSNGYSNGYVLKSKKQPAPKDPNQSTKLDIKNYELDNFQFTSENKQKNKKYSILINDLKGALVSKGEELLLNAKIDVLVQQLGFNLSVGSFLKNKKITSQLHASFNPTTKTLTIQPTILNIDGQDVNTNAFFTFDNDKKNPFSISLEAKDLSYAKAVSWLTEKLTAKLSPFDLQKPVDMNTSIIGHMVYRDTPRVEVNFATKDNSLNVMNTQFEKVAFKGFFLNEVTKGLTKDDANSKIALEFIDAQVSKMPIHCDKLYILNLKKPIVKCNLKANFPATDLNELMGADFDFTAGNVSYDLHYDGPLLQNSLIPNNIIGDINIDNAVLNYVPRNLKLKNLQASLSFLGADLKLNKVHVQSQTSSLDITGYAKDFLQALIESPKSAQMQINIASSMINMNEFKTFFTTKRIVSKAAPAKNKNGKAMRNLSSQLNDFLTDCSIGIDMNVNKLVYNGFVANNFKSNMDFTYAGIKLNNISLNSCGGGISLNGIINQDETNNPFNLSVNINTVEIDQLFNSFGNFGMENLTAKNIDGKFSAKGNILGQFSSAGPINKKSLNGKLSFNLNNGSIKNYEPLIKVSKFAFKNRQLENIKFEKLSNDLTISNGKVIIPPMAINTSALIINVEGIYGFEGGTDMAIAIPLRNPQKDIDRENKGLKKRSGTGIVVKLRATSGSDGKLEVKLDTRSSSPDKGDVIEDTDKNVNDTPKETIKDPAKESKKKKQPKTDAGVVR